MSLNDVKVTIYGQEYPIKTPAKPSYIKEVAAYVNDKMTEISKAGIDTSSQLRIAILATMNITAELFECRKKKDEVTDKIEAKTIAISEFIDDKIVDIESSDKN